MHAIRHFLVDVSLLSASAGTSFAATTAPLVAEATEQPALAGLMGPRAADLRAAGIQRIFARTDKQRRDVQVLTQYGPVHLPWPKNVTPATFEIHLRNDGRLSTYVIDFSEANELQCVAAIDAVITDAALQGTDARVPLSLGRWKKSIPATSNTSS